MNMQYHHACPFRRPTDEELAVLLSALSAPANVCLVPVLFNGEQRYALGTQDARGQVSIFGVIPSPLDQVLNSVGAPASGEQNYNTGSSSTSRRQMRRVGL